MATTMKAAVAHEFGRPLRIEDMAGQADTAVHPGARGRGACGGGRTGREGRQRRRGDSACGRCRYCMTGWETLCAEQKNTGYSVNGGFAEYVLADPDFVGHLPDGLEFAPAAPILCAGVTVYKGLKETEAKPGDTVVISGIGDSASAMRQGRGHARDRSRRRRGVVDIKTKKT